MAGQNGGRVLLFDVDGTLLDSNGVWLEIDADFSRERGLAHSEAYSRTVAHMTPTEAAVYTKDLFGLPESPEEIRLIWNRMAYDYYARRVPLKLGASAFLARRNAEGARMAVLSSCDPDLCRAALSHHGVLSHFEAFFFTHELGMNKRGPAIFLHAAAALGARPSDCMVFEDSPVAAAAAAAAGMAVTGMRDAFFRAQEDDLAAAAVRVIDDFTALP
ncbi:MAG TPA: HAD family phosphatase [Oscillospiraceae bacterium]|nr:HAD family phosphatase [Oscillospiraceae bacterium]